MENNSKWIVYCTTCNINKKIYIGVHKTNPDIFDGYLGNGCYLNNSSTYERSKTRFQRAVKKYGPKNFTRSTIAIFDNEDDAYALEAELLNKGFDTLIAKADGFYKVQVGAYSVRANADKKAAELKALGYNVFITTAENRPDSGSVGYEPTTKLNYKTGNYRVTAARGLNVRSGPSTDYPVLDLSQLSASARAQGGYKAGVVFTALEVVNSTTSAWAKTPSGWVCLELNGSKYVTEE